MRLYLVRHAYAGEHGDPRYPDDRLRPLTDEGRKRFSKAIKHLVEVGFAPTLIATSPLVRCRQTAEVIEERLKGRTELVELEALAPGADLNTLLSWTSEQTADELAWVGHAPDVSLLLAALIGDGQAAIRFAKGAFAAVEFSDRVAAGHGELQWIVSPKVLGV